MANISFAFPIALALSVVATPALAADHPAHHGGLKLSATLSGANEVNAQGARNQGDPDGTGAFSGRLAAGQDELCYTLIWSGIDAPTMAHIHTGADGTNGPVFIGLPDLSAGEHCIPVDREKAATLLARPQDFYVNLHTPAFPAGAVRGQLRKN